MGITLYAVAERRTAGGWERAEPLVPDRALHEEVWAGAARDRGETLPALVRETTWDTKHRYLGDVLLWGIGDWPEARWMEPIVPPRGLPPDATDETRAAWRDEGLGTSWWLVSEIEAWHWEREAVDERIERDVDAPDDGWIAVGSVRFHRGRALRQVVRPLGQSYREACAFFWEVTVPRLRAYGPPDGVRLVAWAG